MEQSQVSVETLLSNNIKNQESPFYYCPNCMKVPQLSITNQDIVEITCFCKGEQSTKKIPLQNFIKEINQNIKQICNYQDHLQQENSTVFCKKCKKWLCNACLQKHHKENADHRPTELKDIIVSKTCETPTCRNIISHYCKTCKIHFCNECKENHSREHSIIDLWNFFSNENFIDFNEEIKRIENQIKENTQKYEDFLNSLFDTFHQLITEKKKQDDLLLNYCNSLLATYNLTSRSLNYNVRNNMKSIGISEILPIKMKKFFKEFKSKLTLEKLEEKFSEYLFEDKKEQDSIIKLREENEKLRKTLNEKLNEIQKLKDFYKKKGEEKNQISKEDQHLINIINMPFKEAKLQLFNIKIQEVLNSIVVFDSKVLGFFVEIPISQTTTIKGILSNSKAIPQDILLRADENINIQLLNKGLSFILLLKGRKIFYDRFSDFTFIEILPGEFRLNFRFLKINNKKISKKSPVIYVTKNDGKQIIEKGEIIEKYGIEYINTIPFHETCVGTPLLLSETLEVIGIFKRIRPNKKETSATAIEVPVKAIQRHYSTNTLDIKQTVGTAKKSLNYNEIETLNKNGLKTIIDSVDIFISPPSQYITPLWFYRTNFAWFWTPTNPLEVEDITLSNWSLILTERTNVAEGGYWDGLEPAERNVKLIKFLANSKLSFLI